MTDYTATDDGGVDEHIEAESMQDACRQAEEWIRDADCWGREPTTQYVSCSVSEDDGDGWHERITVAIDPEEPECPDGYHDWRPAEGGCDENPGVQGNGGGVIIRELCAHCDTQKITDTWAQNPETGEQGLTSVSYV